jgi:hypothetical protein
MTRSEATACAAVTLICIGGVGLTALVAWIVNGGL